MEFIYEIPNVISKEMCEEIIEKFIKDDNKEPSAISGNQVMTNVRKSTHTWMTNEDIWSKISKDIIKVFIDGLDTYSRYLSDIDYLSAKASKSLFREKLAIEQIYVNKSKEGDYYHWHIDSNTSKQKTSRAFSCLIYLNSLEEDQGGCTEFKCGKKIRPEQGKLVIFPSTWTYEHRAAEVKNGGVKYTCGTWISN